MVTWLQVVLASSSRKPATRYEAVGVLWRKTAGLECCRQLQYRTLAIIMFRIDIFSKSILDPSVAFYDYKFPHKFHYFL
jgi:hypothetical protein